ncbi:MAG TPA: zinc-ribbon domain-containing protein [Myxococcales bacterium]
MVVQCPACQSKFRIADDKVTDKGVRVRCTSCKGVFQARRPGAGSGPGAPPGTTVDLASLSASPVGRAASRTPAAVRPVSAAARSSARAGESAARRLEADDLFGMAELTGDAPLPAVSPSAVTKPVARPETAFGDLDLDFGESEKPAIAPSLPPPPPQEDDAPESEPQDLQRAAGAAGMSGGAAPQDPDAGSERPQAPAPAASTMPAPAAIPAAPARSAGSEAPAGRTVLSSVLTGLLGAALAIAVVIASALSGGAPGWLGLGPAADVVATHLVSGVYDTAGGKPVFYVRGRVENRSKKVHGPVRVTAELVADGQSPSTAETMAGAQPSPEDVWSLRTAADAEKLVRTLEAAPVERKLRPGASLPFFAIIADPPADLRRHHLRISLETMDAWNPSAAMRAGVKDK